MKTRLVAGVIILIAIIAVGLIVFNGRHSSPGKQISATTYNNGTTANQTANTSSSKVLFSNTQYEPYSYLIYPGPVSKQAQAALAGFNLTTTTLQNGTVDVNISLLGTNQYQTYMLKPNYKFYIIETSFGDDSFHFDSSFGDDGFVVVDPNGYVVQ